MSQHVSPSYFSHSSFMTRAQVGDRSEGFTTTQLPAAMAEMAGVRLRWKGKFQAPILTHATDAFVPFGPNHRSS